MAAAAAAVAAAVAEEEEEEESAERRGRRSGECMWCGLTKGPRALRTSGWEALSFGSAALGGDWTSKTRR